MAKVKIQGNASGTGVLTVTAPNTSTDRTITLPDSSGTILDNTSTLDATKLSGNLPALNASSLTNVPKDVTVGGRKNEIQNGDFRINQRGAQSWPHSYQFSSDRWQNRTGSNVTWSHNTSSFPDGFTVSAECDAAGSTAQMIELDATGKHGRFASGSTYTLSCWSTVVPTSLVTFSSSYGPENSNDWTGDGVMTSTGETSNGFTKYTQTLTVSSSINAAATGVFVKISGGSAFKFTGVQLEKGSTATDFEYRSYGEELALCQRYYERFIADASAEMLIGVGVNASATGVFINYPYKQIKRVIPSFSSSGASHFERLTASWGAGSSISCQANIATARLNMGGFPSSTIWNATEVRITAAANNAHWFAFDAEL